jgi:16S rRNA (uracil1498-N3)-methyltransferase
LEVACPLPKGDRGQFLIEKLTELGVTGFTPLRTARSVVHPSEGRAEKLERYVIEASKQCGRNVLMQIGAVEPLDKLLQRPPVPRRIVADPAGALLEPGPPMDTIILVGPEGGLADTERRAALAAGWQPVSLGPRVLRVETAALALTALITNTTLSH